VLPIREDVDLAMVHLFTNFGSIDDVFTDTLTGNEVDVLDGTAHFLEHCAFYQDGGRNLLVDSLEKGFHLNAWTSYDHTTYYFNTNSDGIRRSLEYLVSLVTEPYLTEEVIAKEKKIVSQEILRSSDNPWNKLFQNLAHGLFKVHPFRKTILGDVASVSVITPSYLSAVYHKYYCPSNMALVFFVPEDDPLKYFALANEICNKRGLMPGVKPVRKIVEEPAKVHSRRIVAEQNVEEQVAVIGYKVMLSGNGSGRNGLKDMLTNLMLMDMLFERSVPAVHKLVRRNVCKNLPFAHTTYGRGFQMMYFGAYVGDFDVFERVMLDYVRRQLTTGLSKKMFDLLKMSYIKNELEMIEIEDSMNIQSKVINRLAAGFNPIIVPDVLMGLTLDDIIKAGQDYILSSDHTMSVIVPKKR
jgi:predicted Zn-dependent peptidase